MGNNDSPGQTLMVPQERPYALEHHLSFPYRNQGSDFSPSDCGRRYGSRKSPVTVADFGFRTNRGERWNHCRRWKSSPQCKLGKGITKCVARVNMTGSAGVEDLKIIWAGRCTSCREYQSLNRKGNFLILKGKLYSITVPIFPVRSLQRTACYVMLCLWSLSKSLEVMYINTKIVDRRGGCIDFYITTPLCWMSFHSSRILKAHKTGFIRTIFVKTDKTLLTLVKSLQKYKFVAFERNTIFFHFCSRKYFQGFEMRFKDPNTKSSVEIVTKKLERFQKIQFH